MGAKRTRKFHPIPLDIGIANAEGISLNFARLDHVHNHPTGLGFDLHHEHFAYELPNWAPDKFARAMQGLVAPTTGVVRLHAVEVPFRVTISGIRVFHGAVAAGNLRVGLYPAGAGNLPDLEALLAESASIACNGVTRTQVVPFTIGNLQLDPGIYWPVFQVDNDNDTYGWSGRGPEEIAGDHFDYSRDYNLAYGAFTDPCPATASDEYAFMSYLPVISIP